MQYGFASGELWSIVEGTNRTPRQFGTLQDASIDIEFENKLLHGQYKFPVAIGQGKGKISCKASAAHINGKQYAEIMFGDATVTSGKREATTEGGTIPGTPFQITVTQSANFHEDLGVRLVSNGTAMTKVASAPAAGQYSVTAGVYLFNTGDTGKAVLISYAYTPSPAAGQRVALTNQLMGRQSFFAIVLNQSYDLKGLYIRLNRCVGKKLSFATKLDDFQVPNFEWDAFADAAGDIGALGVADE